MNLSRPIHALFPSVEAYALQALVSNPGARSGREVARLAEVSHPAASRALDSLAEQGVLRRERAGRANMYSLNDQHLAMPAIRDLAGVRVNLVQAIRHEVANWEVQALHVSLFGSVARDGGTRESDVDVLVVRPAKVSVDEIPWRAQLDNLSERIFSWTGNHAGLTEIDPSDLERLDTKPVAGALAEVRRDGIQLGGTSLKNLLREFAE